MSIIEELTKGLEHEAPHLAHHGSHVVHEVVKENWDEITETASDTWDSIANAAGEVVKFIFDLF